MLAKIVASWSLLALSIAVGIFVMVYGWGLSPQSWLVVVFGPMVSKMLLGLAQETAKDE